MTPLERCELLTPVGTPAMVAELRHADVRGRDHIGEVLADGTEVLVTPIVLPVTDHGPVRAPRQELTR